MERPGTGDVGVGGKVKPEADGHEAQRVGGPLPDQMFKHNLERGLDLRVHGHKSGQVLVDRILLLRPLLRREHREPPSPDRATQKKRLTPHPAFGSRWSCQGTKGSNSILLDLGNWSP